MSISIHIDNILELLYYIQKYFLDKKSYYQLLRSSTFNMSNQSSNLNSSYTWHYETVSIKKMIPHNKNPRTMSNHFGELLEKNLSKFGLLDKPILNKDYTVIGGHQRIKLLKKLKYKEIECLVSDQLLNDEDIDELCISLNLHTGEFDFDILANSWEPLDLLKYGFTADQLIGKLETDDNKKKENKKKLKMCPNCGHEF